jgi:hypothetical protein
MNIFGLNLYNSSMRNDILKRRAEIEKWIAEHRPKAFICRELRCKPLTLEGYLSKMRLRYEGNIDNKGFKSCLARKHAREYLYQGSVIANHKLKLKLIQDGLKQRRCERCNQITWLTEPITLELHHINGDRFDNPPT